jgi:hypothetical protein
MNIPFFPDYKLVYFVDDTQDPRTAQLKDYVKIINIKNNRYVKPKSFNTNQHSWVLKNPQSDNEGYNAFYNKNIVGEYSQTLYEKDIYKIIKINCKS